MITIFWGLRNFILLKYTNGEKNSYNNHINLRIIDGLIAINVNLMILSFQYSMCQHKGCSIPRLTSFHDGKNNFMDHFNILH